MYINNSDPKNILETRENVRPQSFFNRETGLNGDFGRGTPTKGIQNGAIVVSWNLLGGSFLQETSVENFGY
jgi:hypothetical protein